MVEKTRILQTASVLWLAGCAVRDEAPARSAYSNDTSKNRGFVPNPAFVPVTPAIGTKRSKLSLEDEVVVLEGDAATVSAAGGGSFGITEGNQVAIVQAVLAEHPDVFDTIQIYTSFVDDAHVGTAYYQSISNAVQGIGIDAFDGRAGWGLAGPGRLSGFSNMNSMLMWGGGSFADLNQIGGRYHAVIGQELSHRWLFHMLFDDGGGPRDDLIGRQGAHWSRLAHSEGSVQDGQWWEKVSDRLFRNRGTDLGFAPLDLYAMGFIGSEEVPDFFYLTGATLDGNPLGKESPVPSGVEVVADDHPVTMADVLRAMGPRNPPVATETPYYRAAFVLVTAPGEPRSSWGPHLDVLKEVARDFPESWRRWTEGSSALCTKVSERCPEPKLGLAGHRVIDGNDGLVAAGESFDLHLSLINAGLGTARNVAVEVVPIGAGSTVSGSPAILPSIGEGAIAEVPSAFRVAVSSTVACGDAIAFALRYRTEEGPVFSGELTIGVGTKQLRIDPLDEAPDWVVDPEELDTAIRGKWELGEPELVAALGVVTQPPEDHSPGESKLAFLTGAAKGDAFSANDLDGGATTLESPAFALRGTRDPKVVFWYWRRAVDLSVDPEVEIGRDAAIVVQVTNDGGATWTELGRVVDQTKEWKREAFRIRDAVEPTHRTKFRFIVTDESRNGTVEAGIDDVEIVDFLDTCEIDVPGPAPDAGTGGEEPDERGGCSSAGGASPALLALLWIVSRKRR
jgi:hypothetical protein